MSCAELGKSLFDLIDGRLSGPQELRAHDHLQGCAACSERVAAWRRALPGLRQAEPPAPDFMTIRRMELAITRELSRAPAPRLPVRRWRPLWAAGLALAAAAVVLVAARAHFSARPPVAMARVETVFGTVTAAGRPVRAGEPLPVGQVVAVTGTGASLAIGRAATVRVSGSALLTIEEADAAVRLRLETGELEAQVEPRRSGEQFAVVLKQGRVEVRGTRFAVGYRDGGSWLRVDEGKVAAFDAGGRLARLVAPGETHWLSPVTPAAEPPPSEAPAPTPRADSCKELQRSCLSAVARTRAAIRASDGPRAVAASAAEGIAVGGCGIDDARQCLDELQYLRAEALRLAGRLPAAVLAYRALDRASASAATRQNALFAAAELERRLGQRERAVRDYQRALAVKGATGLREEAMLGIMETAEEAGDTRTALAAARQYLASYPAGHGAGRARALLRREGVVSP